jgi:hypothetical protein
MCLHIKGLNVKVNYLNNKDILKEIHKSKTTYCSFLEPSFADYDLILPNLEQIDKTNIDIARQNRADRFTKLAHEKNVAETGEKRKLDEFEVDVATILDTDIVFRVMSWEHVPIDVEKTNKYNKKMEEEMARSEYDLDDDELTIAGPTMYVKCNFPPFQHYKIGDNNVPYCVGKSHWKGDIVTGNWSREHGAMTKKLALMFIKLCERYATRSNWRGYTYNDEMRSQALLQLSHIGLQFDESKSQNPFAYYTAAITNSFNRVLNIEKRNQNLRDDILEMNNMSPSYTRQGASSGHYADGDD